MGAELMPRLPQMMKPIRGDEGADRAKTSPCAKLIMPMMP